MSDSEGMDVISKLHEVDPVFREVTELLFGDAVDVRELYDITKMHDASEVHVNGALKKKCKKCKGRCDCEKVAKKELHGAAAEARRQKRQAQVGLASNVVGITAGGVALGSALRDDRLKDPEGPKAAKKLAAMGDKLPKVSPRTGKAAAYTAMGAGALQLGNLAGDAVANRVLARESKKKVSKALTGALEEIIKARQAGQIDTSTALQMAENLVGEVEKKITMPTVLNPKAMYRIANNNMGHPVPARAARAKHKVAGLNPKTAKARQRTANAQAVADAPKAKRAVLVATGAAGATAGAVSGAAYSARQHRKQQFGKADLVDYAFTGEISKMDEDKRLAFGWCSLSTIDGQPVVDLQGDYIPIEEIEKSAYAYVVDSRIGGDMHARDGDKPRHTADLVESFIATPEKLQQMGISEEVAKSIPTGWWVGMRVNDDEQWAMVKDGRRKGFSVHGKGSRVQKALEM